MSARIDRVTPGKTGPDNLPASKMATTAKKEGIRQRRFGQSSTKHALSSPYDLTWPPLEKGANQLIITGINTTFEYMMFRRLCTQRKKQKQSSQGENVEKGGDGTKEEDNERAKLLEQRASCLVIGTNEVVRGLEQGSLKLVLVNRSVKLGPLLEHILILCATRKTPACALSGMDESVPELLGVSRVAAFGFKNSDKTTPFDALVEFIKANIPPLHVPWLQPWKNQGKQSETASLESDLTEDKQTDSSQMESRSGKVTITDRCVQVSSKPDGSQGTEPSTTEIGKKRKRSGKGKQSNGKELTETGSCGQVFSKPDASQGTKASTTEIGKKRKRRGKGKQSKDKGLPERELQEMFAKHKAASLTYNTELRETFAPGSTKKHQEEPEPPPEKKKLTMVELKELFVPGSGHLHEAKMLEEREKRRAKKKEEKKKRRKEKAMKTKKKQQKKPTLNAEVRLVYMRPSIKSIDTGKDKVTRQSLS